MIKSTVVTIISSLIILGSTLELKNGAYEGLVFKIADSVPAQECRVVLDNLEASLTSASQYLFSALDSRAFLRSATVLLPPTWPDSCASSPVVSGSGETPDVTVLPRLEETRGRIYTQQSLGCGQGGDQIYLTYDSLMQSDGTLARSFVKEFAKYRYGVFDEQGYSNDPIYPMCYYDDETKKPRATGCSDLPIHDNGICTGSALPYNTSKMVDDKARSSIMFAPEAPSVSMFCDDGNHDRFAPTKHNSICQRRSVLDVVLGHSDFAVNNRLDNLNTHQITDTTPRITYKRQNMTRFVFVIENTKDMMQRESWSFLKLYLRYWALNVLPDNSEIGLVLAQDSSSKRELGLLSVNRKNSNEARDKFHSAIPYTPEDSIQPGCLSCGLKDAVEMLSARTKTNGPANNVIVLIAAGMNPSAQLDKIAQESKQANIKIATITYPALVRSQLLNSLAKATQGVAYTVFERKLNVDTSLLTTYFELQNVLTDINSRFYSGPRSDLPLDIHRKKITDDGRTSISGSFVLDPNMGNPARFTFFTHNTITPFIKGLKLISPSHRIYAQRNDRFIDFKMIGLRANISEPGTWTYTIEPYPGNPQPHFLQVTATPLSDSVPVIRAKFRTHHSNGNTLIFLVDVKKGEIPVLGAKVEVTVTKLDSNNSAPTKIELLDTGSGDPDITRGDGVYTRYFSPEDTGLYSFEVLVTDNGNTAYTWTESPGTSDGRPCCGSSITPPGVVPISPFQRTLPKVTEFLLASNDSVEGRIGDLKVHVVPEDMKARLMWTSPDMGGSTVSGYEIKYAGTIKDIVDGFETSASVWDKNQPFPLAPGSETTFTLDMSQNRGLLDKALYFAVKSLKSDSEGLVSNWVRVMVPSPPPPPTVPPSYSSDDNSFFGSGTNNYNNQGVDLSPAIAKTMGYGLELILPIAIGFVLLVILLVLYCYFCILKRRDHHSDNHKNKHPHGQGDKLSSTITIVPSTPQNVGHLNQSAYSSNDLALCSDPHQIGVPIQYGDCYDDDTKKRYSLVNQQEQQLIEELKQQQMAQSYNNSGLSVISNNGTLTNRAGHILSPYNSWSASQLLHEHERRHSPMDNMMEQDQINPQDLLISPQQEHHYQSHIPPPVPPLPVVFNGGANMGANGYPPNYSIYGVHQQSPPGHQIYQSMQRSETLGPFNPSLQGSMSSVNSGDKKRRNVTMV